MFFGPLARIREQDPRARQLHPLQHCDEICPLSADSINCVRVRSKEAKTVKCEYVGRFWRISRDGIAFDNFAPLPATKATGSSVNWGQMRKPGKSQTMIGQSDTCQAMLSCILGVLQTLSENSRWNLKQGKEPLVPTIQRSEGHLQTSSPKNVQQALKLKANKERSISKPSEKLPLKTSHQPTHPPSFKGKDAPCERARVALSPSNSGMSNQLGSWDFKSKGVPQFISNSDKT